MTVDPAHVPGPAACPQARGVSPGRPKDMTKRAAILEAAKRLFTLQGYEGVSMDQIAAEAGVSKLTVYSHFGDKETLFVDAVKEHCERQLPASLFDEQPGTTVRGRLLDVARAFFQTVGTPDALAGHRMMCTSHLTGSTLPRLFWEAGPARIQRDFCDLLQRRVASGDLAIDDVPLAAEQFFTLLKGDLHLKLLLGFGNGGDAAVDRHLRDAVEMFLRAYGTAPENPARRTKARSQ